MPAPKLHAERDPDFVYVIYIAASQQKVWDALTDGETVRPWWADTRHESTFEPGSAVVFRRQGKVDVRGEILEREAPRRLVYTFHVEGPGPQHDEGPSLVTYELAASGAATRLTITHANFPRNSRARAGVSKGWPTILSGLKTMLESGVSPRYEDWTETAGAKQ
jgi:uncharacterized protein YndB with AHSA1/START domain